MSVDGRVAVTARAWHIATGDRPPSLAKAHTRPAPLPTKPSPQSFYPGLDDWGYGRSIDGLGLAHADLFDADGFIGEVAQPLLIQRRDRDSG